MADYVMLILILMNGDTPAQVIRAEECARIEESLRSGAKLKAQLYHDQWQVIAKAKCVPLTDFVGMEATQ